MKLKHLLPLLILTLMSCKYKEATNETSTSVATKLMPPQKSPLSGTFRYNYPHAEDGSEDQFIIIENRAGSFVGTSDEFDWGREGYFPGYFKVELQDLSMTDSTISFELAVKPEQIFADQFKPTEKPSGTVWAPGQGMNFPPQKYSGTISGDTITLEHDMIGKRIFIKE